MELGDPPQRRFHMSAMDNGTRRVLILESVRAVLLRNVRASERRRITQSVLRSRLNPSESRRVVSTVVDAVETWLQDEFRRPESMLASRALTEERQTRKEELLLSLPYEFFPDRGKPQNTEDDREMVAEAVVTGTRLLVSEDRSSIKQERLNEWLLANELVSGRGWIRTTRRMLEAVEREVCSDISYIWCLGAFLPDKESTQDVLRARRGIAALEKVAGMRYVAQRAKEYLEADPSPEKTIALVRARFPDRARDTEMRRVEATRQAAIDEGFDYS